MGTIQVAMDGVQQVENTITLVDDALEHYVQVVIFTSAVLQKKE